MNAISGDPIAVFSVQGLLPRTQYLKVTIAAPVNRFVFLGRLKHFTHNWRGTIRSNFRHVASDSGFALLHPEFSGHEPLNLLAYRVLIVLENQNERRAVSLYASFDCPSTNSCSLFRRFVKCCKSVTQGSVTGGYFPNYLQPNVIGKEVLRKIFSSLLVLV